MPLYWIAYIFLARAFVVIVESISQLFSFSKTLKHGLVAVAVMAIIGFGLGSSWRFPFEYPYHDSPYYRYVDENVPEVRHTADWLREHFPPSSKIAGTSLNLQALNFLGRGAYTIAHLGGDSVSLPQFYALVGDRAAAPMFLQRGLGKWNLNYGIFSEHPLVDLIQNRNIDYLVLSESPDFYRSLRLIPDYFYDHPAFRFVHSTHWNDRNKEFALHVLEIDRSRLEDVQYPVIITTKVWPVLLADAAKKSGKPVDIAEVVDTLFYGEPIVFRPASPKNMEYYRQVADAYASLGRWDIAAFEYHSALAESSVLPPDISLLAETWAREHGDAGGTWLLLGDVRTKVGDREGARAAYEQALSTANGDALVEAAAHAALGSSYWEHGAFAQAVIHFDQSLETHIFGAPATRLNRQLALAAWRQARGSDEGSILAYQEAIQLNPMAMADLYLNADADTRVSGPLLGKTFDKILATGTSAQTLQHPQLLPSLELVYRTMDNPEALARVYARMTENGEDNAENWYALGDAYERLARLDEAADAYEQAIESMPAYAPPYIRLMQLYQRQGAMRQALDVYHRGRRSLPDEPQLHLALAELYLSRASELP